MVDAELTCGCQGLDSGRKSILPLTLFSLQLFFLFAPGSPEAALSR
jgi:hypothetical protein